MSFLNHNALLMCAFIYTPGLAPVSYKRSVGNFSPAPPAAAMLPPGNSMGGVLHFTRPCKHGGRQSFERWIITVRSICHTQEMHSMSALIRE